MSSWAKLRDPKAWRRFLGALTRVLSPEVLAKKRVFILGSYRPDYRERLELIRDCINRMEDWFAFLMSDIKGLEKDEEEDLIAKFFFLGRWADVILLVLEHDVGGHVLELGMVSVLGRYREKTYELVRRDVLNRVSAMVRGLLDYYRGEGRCVEFKDDEELRGLVSQILATGGSVRQKL